MLNKREGERVPTGIVGGSGYGGAELIRLISGHPGLQLEAIAAGSSAGARIDEALPHLAGLPATDGVFLPAEPDVLSGCELVFLATPHATSLELAPGLLDHGATVVDLSGAFRLDAATFETWYGLEHTAVDLAPAPYGLPELFRSTLRGARLIAGPGCYPTATLLALTPLTGLIERDSVVVVGMSGTSGAGKGLRDDLHSSHAFGNAAAYGAPGHRHTPEIEARWAEAARLAGTAHDPSDGEGDRGGEGEGGPDADGGGGVDRDGGSTPLTFVPHLIPTARGQLCTVSAVLRAGATADDVGDRFAGMYKGEPFVTVLGEGAWPATTHVVGGNAAHIGVATDARTGRVTVSCAIDNLIKGASGQALQAANAALGFDEGLGLTPAGLYP